MDGDSRQNPAYRATLLPIRWAQVKTALTFLHFPCTSCYITCRRFECFYGESMGKYGQFDGQISTTNNIPKLFLLGQFPKLLERLFFKLGGRRLKLRSLSCLELSSFMQNLECFDGIPWAKTWACGQNRGHRSFR
jgi:hypothetical protein